MSVTTTPSPEVSTSERALTRSLFKSTSSLGIAISLERALTFASNVLAARLAGPHSFGAYSLALTTANNVASYAGAGIGTTANRFSGKYPEGSPEYQKLVRTLALVSAQSALIAVVTLWFVAGPLARHLLANPSLTRLLRLAAFSSGAIIALECFRGFLIGQRKYRALMLLSIVAGSALIISVPLAALRNPNAMIGAQALSAVVAVVVCGFALRKSLGIKQEGGDASAGPNLASVWRFSVVQLAGVIGLNAAGWWISSLVTRTDPSLMQMGLFAAANQIRNIVALLPGLVAQGNFALFAEESSRDFGGPDKVLAKCTMMAGMCGLTIAGSSLLVLPWVLSHVYGNSFASAGPACGFAIATALVHMGFAPAAARLTIVSLRWTTVINAIWAAIVIVAGPILVPHGGALPAAVIFFAAHLTSGLLVLCALWKRDSLPTSILPMCFLMAGAAVSFAIFSWMRYVDTSSRGLWGLLILATTVLALLLSYGFARVSGQERRIFLSSRFSKAIFGRDCEETS